MTRLFLAAGVAALAISAPAAARPGNGHGGGHAQKQQQHGKTHAQARGGGGGHAQASGGGHGKARAHVQARGGGHSKARSARVQSRGHERVATRSGHGQQHHSTKAKHGRSVRVAHEQKAHGKAQHRQQARVEARGKARVQADRHEVARRDRDRVLRAQAQRFGRNNNPVVVDRDFARVRDVRRARLADTNWGIGCPPGLARKPVACMPPGQARSLVGRRLASIGDRVTFRDVPQRLRYVYRDTPDYYYRFGDGYMYRVNRDTQLISALMPLFGLGYTVGQPFPTAYSNYYLPAAYQPFYPSTPYYDYRYANGYVYQVDPYTGLIADVDPMLGYGYGYGQMLPASYSAYNLPYQYRPLYYDTSDYYYRYAPGAIYQVDPTTSLITAVAALLSPGLTVGQPLPMGYSAYNVPYAYRANYYDTPNDWYRYSNGYVYRVDPTTQLVTAIVASALA